MPESNSKGIKIDVNSIQVSSRRCGPFLRRSLLQEFRRERTLSYPVILTLPETLPDEVNNRKVANRSNVNPCRHRRDGDPGAAVYCPGPPASQSPSLCAQAVDGPGATAETGRQLRRPAHHRAGDAGVGRGGERAGRQLEQIRGAGLADQSAASGRLVSRRRPDHRRGDVGCRAARIGQHPSSRLRTGSVGQLAAASHHEQQ